MNYVAIRRVSTPLSIQLQIEARTLERRASQINLVTWVGCRPRAHSPYCIMYNLAEFTYNVMCYSGLTDGHIAERRAPCRSC